MAPMRAQACWAMYHDGRLGSQMATLSPGPSPRAHEAAGQGVGAPPELREGQPLVVEDEGLAVRILRGRPVEQRDDGGVGGTGS